MKDVLVVSPYGFFRLNKVPYQFMPPKRKPPVTYIAECSVSVIDPNEETPTYSNDVIVTVISPPEKLQKRSNGRMLSIEERIVQADSRAAEAVRQEKAALKQEHEAEVNFRYYIIGKLFAKYLPEVAELNPGTDEQNADTFKLLEAFLYVLANDHDTLEYLKEVAEQTATHVPEECWRMPADTP